MSEELYYMNQLQALEDTKNTYFRQLDEIEKKRAEIAMMRQEIKSDESLIVEEYGKIREAKKLISMEYEELLIKNEELRLSKKEFEKRREEFSRKEKDLRSRVDRYNLDLDSLEKRKSEHYRILRSQFEKELAIHKRQDQLEKTQKRLDRREQKIVARKAELASMDIGIDVDSEKVERKRNYVDHLLEILNVREQEVESRKCELVQLRQRTEEEIGKHVTMHRQHLDIRKLDARTDQQSEYIRTLEEEVMELNQKLDKAMADLKEMAICSKLLERNLCLQQMSIKPFV
jgi:chromosome segregation ATPase